jgi:DNA-binding transcriptional LysR family regulator
MDVNFELYKIFYHTASSGSFSDAAEKLFISQSAVSQAIKNLETKVGVQLFSRQSRRVKLTNEGELLFKHIEQAYNFIKTAENKLVEVHDLNHGEVRIGASDTVCKYHLMPSLERFYQKYPHIKIKLINRTSLQLVEILKEGLIDFGFVTLPVKDSGIIVEDYITVQDIFVASSMFSDLKDRKVNLQELCGHPLLMLDKNSTTRKNINSYALEKGLELKPEIELESIDLLIEFAKIGLGIAHVLKESAKESIEKQELFEVHINENLPSRKLGIITVKKVPLSRASSEFIRLMKSVD